MKSAGYRTERDSGLSERHAADGLLRRCDADHGAGSRDALNWLA
jgi:hypothetical protein